MKIQFRFEESYPGATYKAWNLVAPSGHPDFCCEQMEAAYKGGAIQFGGQIMTKRDECELSIWYWNCYPEGASLDRYPISFCFCPFCGIAIELSELQSTDV